MQTTCPKSSGKDGQFKALIDFDDAIYPYLTFDLARLMNPFVPQFDWDSWSDFEKDENVFDFYEAKTIVREYTRYRPLTEQEKAHLFDVFKLTVMFDCIWYFARGTANDFYEKRKIAYLNDLECSGFYNAIFE